MALKFDVGGHETYLEHEVETCNHCIQYMNPAEHGRMHQQGLNRMILCVSAPVVLGCPVCQCDIMSMYMMR